MAENYLSIKLTLTRIGDGQYRSRIEESPLGASRGTGCDFPFVAADRARVTAFQTALAAGASGRLETTDFGRWIFDLVFGKGEVLIKLRDCRAVANAQKAKLRICLAILAEDLIDVPWEYFHDGSDFLINPDCSVVRVIDELPERNAPFAPIQKLLVAIANPVDPVYAAFDAPAHLAQLQARFKAIRGLEVKPLFPATKRDILDELAGNNYDAFYFLGHGEYSAATGGQLICEKAAHAPDPLPADRLARALRESKTVRFAYLNSCSTAVTSRSNPFMGVAQRLMRDGDVAAVVAMQSDVAQEAAMEMAGAFFGQLRKGRSPELAMLLSRGAADDHFSFGVPVLYTHLAGPDRFDQNRLASLLSAEIGKSTFALLLPTFEQGVPSENKAAVKVTVKPPRAYIYPGATFAETDAMAASYVTDLLTRVTDAGNIELFPLSGSAQAANASHLFAFGSKSNDVATAILNQFSPTFRFHYGDDKWTLEDVEFPTPPHEIPNPSHLGKAYYQNVDYGVIQKIVRGPKVFFILSGLGDRATQGCAWYLRENWEGLLEKYGDKPFGLILRFPGVINFKYCEEIERSGPSTVQLPQTRGTVSDRPAVGTPPARRTRSRRRTA